MEPVISHIEITVGDLDRAAAFYDRFLPLLGYSLAHRHAAEIPAHDKRVVSYEHPRLGIAITSPRREFAGRPVQRRRPGALHHLAFRVASREEVDMLYRQLLDIGANVDIAPRAFPEFTPAGYYALFLRDPDGMRLEIVNC